MLLRDGRCVSVLAESSVRLDLFVAPLIDARKVD
jgi:hypothetical protein